MAMLCALDWRHGLVVSSVTADPGGGVRLVLGHGGDELVLHLSPESVDALTYAGLTCPRPPGKGPWDLALASCL